MSRIKTELFIEGTTALLYKKDSYKYRNQSDI